mmetsp:Transcript_28656/g.59164  ORF Transcript_28656/g.59164 Transcript_28656/m.59164 type:complete len:416 (+) Transcript_28656:20-1267(+)
MQIFNGLCFAVLAQRLLALVPSEHPVKGGDVCLGGSQYSNATPSLRFCNCQGGIGCPSQVLLRLFGVTAGPEPWMHANSMEINVSEELWSSRRFHNQEDTSDFSETSGVSSYLLISEGMGLGTFASGVYAALSGYVGESGAYPLNLMHFVTSSRGTGFQTSEISEIHTCSVYEARPPAAAGDDSEASDGSDDGDDGSDTETDVNTTTTGPALYQPPTEVFCGRELATSPSRVKLNIYGYTWGSKWATDTSGQEYFFYRVRLCFSRIQDWYINQARRGEGILGTGQEVEVLDFQQEGGGTFGYWFPKFYWTGNHLNCTFADLLWDLPKWACPMGQFGAVRVTASHAGDTCDGEGTDGVVLNIGFDLDHVGTKDRWFMYSMEVNLTGSVTFAVVGASARLRPLMLAPLYLVLLFRKL